MPQHLDPYIFDSAMRAIDLRLSARVGDVFNKTMLAYMEITGESRIPVVDEDYTGIYDQFHGVALVHKISDWYKSTYGRVGDMPGFGKRRILIRGALFPVVIPAGFNVDPSVYPIDRYLPNVPSTLFGLLTPQEVQDAEAKCHIFFKMGSRLALFRAKLNFCSCRQEIKELASRAREDLESASESLNSHDPNPALWSCLQATEKYLKVFILFHEPTMVLDDLRKKYSHDLVKLSRECSRLNVHFTVIHPFVDAFTFTAGDRYEKPKWDVATALSFVDQAYAACDLVAQSLNHTIGKVKA
jgi:hypothetical protein